MKEGAKRIFASLFFLSLYPAVIQAQTNEISLRCAYSHTVDAQGNVSQTSGEDYFSISYAPNGSARIIKDDLGAEFVGSVSDEEIVGQTSYEIQGTIYSEELQISRNTGELYRSFKSAGRKAGLVHVGKCRKVTGKLF